MTGARQLLDRLRAAGVRFGFDGDRLHIQGPATILTEAVYQQILYYKADLRELIWSEPSTSEPYYPAAVNRHNVPRQSAGAIIEASFRDGVRVQVRQGTPSRYSLWLRSERRWARRRGSDSPSPDHARRIAEQCFGPPINDWYTVESEESL